MLTITGFFVGCSVSKPWRETSVVGMRKHKLKYGRLETDDLDFVCCVNVTKHECLKPEGMKIEITSATDVCW